MMHAIEFEADIENHLLRIPSGYKIPDKAHARVIILTQEPYYRTTIFNPRSFFGIGKQSKQACDAYLANAREGWG